MENRLKIRYKFKNKDEIHLGIVSWKQFENLKKISLIEYCEVEHY